MRIISNGSERGIALMMVMIAMFVLTILVGAFAYSMKVEMKLAQNANNEAELIWLGRSGVELARYVLAQQMSIPNEPYDSLNQKWAGGPGGLGTSNSPLAEISLKDFQVGEGKISITIVDLERKFNVNTADENLLQRALSLIGVDASESAGISSSILDWTDPDNSTRINGTESDFYQTLEPPYYAKNKPVDDLSELMLVNGVTPDIFWGTGSTNYMPAAFERYDRHGRLIEEPVYVTGLVDLFTPISNGRVNINTASATVLSVVLAGDEAMAAQIVKLRAGPDGIDGTEDDTPAGSPGLRIEDLLRSAGVSLPGVQQLSRYFTTRSSTFEVDVQAEIGGSQRAFRAVLGRNGPRDVQILTFSWK